MSTPNPTITVKELHDDVLTALKMFGTYSFSDKGAHEVMDISALVARIRALPALEAAKVLRSLAHSGPAKKRVFMAMAASAIVLDLQEWDEFMGQPGIDDLLNDEEPELLAGDTPHTK